MVQFGHRLVLLFLFFVVALVSTTIDLIMPAHLLANKLSTTINHNQSLVSVEDLMRYAVQEENRILQEQRSFWSVSLLGALEENFRLPPSGEFFLQVKVCKEDTLRKQTNLLWVYVAKATVVPPSPESPYRKIFLDSFDPVDQKTMTALYSNGLPSTC
ncbi:hypothetical protein HPP92_023855 [Vanilla planifolia]|uniref:Uncharacterized protein n=1 Tax=Vanilla planifolia TaxID=51239 RepID=A0A835PKG3_VANPL|nr:hypothetical protein HPP92_024216 [Vanilla planifolia]KAG0456067.1 hypothetical protein HPP92_023855 [Vanilla planifolia]